MFRNLLRLGLACDSVYALIRRAWPYHNLAQKTFNSVLRILATASTLHAHGITDIQTAGEAAEALRPIAGNLAFLLFALGIIGTGLLAIPVLAGSGAYAVAELFGWPSTLEAKFPEAVGFYTIISAATVIGFAWDFCPSIPFSCLSGLRSSME